MNISKENIDELNAVVTLKVEEPDYQAKVEDALKDYRKKANIRGFRPGKVPLGMIRKMYYKPILLEEINRLVSDRLMSYIYDEKLPILGEPMPHNGEQKELDFDNDKEFEFKFDIGLAPEFTSDVTEKDKIPYYIIKVKEEIISENVENIAKRFGEFVEVETAGTSELLTVELYQLDEQNNRLEEGFYAQDARMSLDIIKDEGERKLFEGKKVEESVIFNLRKAYPSDAEISGLLNIDRKEAEKVDGNYMAVIKAIREYKKHEVNQELFDKVYGEGIVNSEEEFRKKIEEELKMNYERESNYRFLIDAKEYFIKKANIQLPVEFLKRWIVASNEEMTEEKVESEFSGYENEFRWQLIRDRIAKAYDIKVSDEELFEYAFILAKNQFIQYGLHNVPDEQIEVYAKGQLDKPEERRRLKDQKYEDKIVHFIKETVKLDQKEVTEDAFRKLFES